MSVYKSRRKDAAAEFISAARELRKTTMRIIKKFPTSYRWIITNNMLTLANEIYTCCIKANSIYVHKDMTKQDFELRHRYLVMAIGSTEALLSEISFCYELIDEGNNFFPNSSDYNKAFQKWTEIGSAVLQKIRGVLNSDKKRWLGYQAKISEKQ